MKLDLTGIILLWLIFASLMSMFTGLIAEAKYNRKVKSPTMHTIGWMLLPLKVVLLAIIYAGKILAIVWFVNFQCRSYRDLMDMAEKKQEP